VVLLIDCIDALVGPKEVAQRDRVLESERRAARQAGVRSCERATARTNPVPPQMKIGGFLRLDLVPGLTPNDRYGTNRSFTDVWA